MRFTVNKPTDIDVAYVQITVPVRYEDEDMPFDFPFRRGDTWCVKVDIETGKILGWPPDAKGLDLHMKVTDCGTYVLQDEHHRVIASIEENYVPHGVVPGEYGDYLEFFISDDGLIENWPKRPNVGEFFDER